MKFLSTLIVIGSIFGGLQALTAQENSHTDHGKTGYWLSDQQKKYTYDSDYHYTPAVRAGDFVYISGVIAGKRRSQDTFTKDDYATSMQYAFDQIKKKLELSGATMENIVHMRTFHVFDSPIIDMSRADHVLMVAHEKNKYISEPFNSWTAVGTTGLLSPGGLVEIEVVAYAPLAKD